MRFENGGDILTSSKFPSFDFYWLIFTSANIPDIVLSNLDKNVCNVFREAMLLSATSSNDSSSDNEQPDARIPRRVGPNFDKYGNETKKVRQKNSTRNTFSSVIVSMK